MRNVLEFHDPDPIHDACEGPSTAVGMHSQRLHGTKERDLSWRTPGPFFKSTSTIQSSETSQKKERKEHQSQHDGRAVKYRPLDMRDSCRHQLATAGVTCTQRDQDHDGQNSSMNRGRSSPRPHACWQLTVAEGGRVTLFRGCGCWQCCSWLRRWPHTHTHMESTNWTLSN